MTSGKGGAEAERELSESVAEQSKFKLPVLGVVPLNQENLFGKG